MKRIYVRSLRWENQGIQYRSIFWIGIGVGHWWRFGMSLAEYDRGKGLWMEVFLGWCRIIVRLLMKGLE